MLPLAEVKVSLSELVGEVRTTHERVTITRKGRPVAVLLSIDELEAIEETIEILSNPSALRSIEAGRDALARGDTADQGQLLELRAQLRRPSE